ncbi:MAG TPA: NnrS family protein, partial [Bryobacteraceae bacterium]|nr:NnrS family protein [Bryobacteraceae bacterium]
HAAESVSPAWLQAHGHAQIFGWVGTFILGIGFFSLSRMGPVPGFVLRRGWTCLALWAPGVALRWIAGVSGWGWRFLLPLSSALEIAAFFLFFWTVSGHRASGKPEKREPWMFVVIAATFGFLLSLALNAAAAWSAAIAGTGPALGHMVDQQLVELEVWGFLAITIWGFNARWLPIFLGARAPRTPLLLACPVLAWLGMLADFTGHQIVFAVSVVAASVGAIAALRIFETPAQPAKTLGVHRSFPHFIRLAYVWLLAGAALSLYAAFADHAGGIWGASRHAVTVGFVSTMIFAIGQRVLPAFCGARVLFSPGLMFASLAILNVGCALRVGSEIPAYELSSPIAWGVLPASAAIEVTAFTLFAASLVLTLMQPPSHQK